MDVLGWGDGIMVRKGAGRVGNKDENGWTTAPAAGLRFIVPALRHPDQPPKPTPAILILTKQVL
jgi:hypothetical protein